MVANYAKLDITSFRKKLKNNEYKSATGARRAIGRMTTWTEKDKDSARKLVDKHFGGAPSNAKSKKQTSPDEGAVSKPTRKGTAKKAGRKAPKREERTVEPSEEITDDIKAARVDDFITKAERILDVTAKAGELSDDIEFTRKQAKETQQALTSATNILVQMAMNAEAQFCTPKPKVAVEKPDKGDGISSSATSLGDALAKPSIALP